MTRANRPFALVLAAAMFALLWVPTLTMQARAADPAMAGQTELA